MSGERDVNLVERALLFVAWPVIAPVLLACVAFALLVAWAAILVTDIKIKK